MINDSRIKKLKQRIIEISSNNKIVHISVKNGHRKIISAKSRITGIYDRFITVKSFVKAYEELFTITYISILTGDVYIEELNDNKTL